MDRRLPLPLANIHNAAVQAAATSPAETAAPTIRQLDAGHALKLRATQLSILRVAHGRVWATLTGVGSDAGGSTRVLAGDHFLSRGDSLTLLPGQEIVIEPFGIGHADPAQFSWHGLSGAVHLPSGKSTAAVSEWRTGVLQPLQDLRHALGLVGGASARLLQGLGQSALTAGKVPSRGFAMLFVANNDRSISARVTFDQKNAKNAAVRGVQPSPSVRLAEPPNAEGLACARTQGCSA